MPPNHQGILQHLSNNATITYLINDKNDNPLLLNNKSCISQNAYTLYLN